MTREELRRYVDHVESQYVNGNNLTRETLSWIKTGPQSVKELLRDYDLLKASFEVNASETNQLREKLSAEWQRAEQYKASLEKISKVANSLQNELDNARQELEDLMELCYLNGLPVTLFRCGKPQKQDPANESKDNDF